MGSTAKTGASGLSWNYDREELLADGVVHTIGVGLALIGAVLLIVVSGDSTQVVKTASVLIYAAGLLTMLGISAAYNMWPASPRKWLLRRFDHSAIYLLIAATYTPFIAQMKAEIATVGLLLGVWCFAIVGIVLKLALPGRLDRLSIGLYLLLGWSGIMAYEPIAAALPGSALCHRDGGFGRALTASERRAALQRKLHWTALQQRMRPQRPRPDRRQRWPP
jgi:hemolysin III